MTDTAPDAPVDDEADETAEQAAEQAGGPSPVVAGLRRTRRALWIAVGVAVPVFLLVAVLATRPPSTQRAVKTPLLGKPAPPIESTTVDGSSASLAELRGKWVVVNFFATWCVPCRQEHPDLVSFSQAHGAMGDAAVLAVVYSDNTQAVREFRDKEGGTWPMLTDPKGRIALDYGVAGVPESFVISPDGLVAAKVVGGVRGDYLERLLNQLKTGR